MLHLFWVVKCSGAGVKRPLTDNLQIIYAIILDWVYGVLLRFIGGGRAFVGISRLVTELFRLFISFIGQSDSSCSNPRCNR